MSWETTHRRASPFWASFSRRDVSRSRRFRTSLVRFPRERDNPREDSSAKQPPAQPEGLGLRLFLAPRTIEDGQLMIPRYILLDLQDHTIYTPSTSRIFSACRCHVGSKKKGMNFCSRPSPVSLVIALTPSLLFHLGSRSSVSPADCIFYLSLTLTHPSINRPRDVQQLFGRLPPPSP